MKILRAISLLVIIALSALCSRAQVKCDYLQLKNYSPLGISVQGMFYNKIHSYSNEYNGVNYSSNKQTMDLEDNKSFSYSIGIDYTFYRANKLSFILNVSLDIINEPVFKSYAVSADYTKCDIEKWISSTYPSIAFLMQYRQNLSSKLYFNAKGGLKILGNTYSNVYFRDAANIIYNNAVVSHDKYNPSILLAPGLSYACNFALIDFNLIGNFSLGQFLRETYMTNSASTSYSIEQSGTYYGIGISFHPKMWWKK